MDTLKLIEPCEEYAQEIWTVRQELSEADDNDSFAGCQFLEKCSSAQEWIDMARLWRNAETCPEGRVPSNVYLAVRESDNRIVGIIDMRHHIDHPILGVWGGHSGYIVRPSERKKGYGSEILRLVKDKARELGLEKIMVTCNDTNTASEKVIKGNGGVFERNVEVDGEIIERFWITL